MIRSAVDFYISNGQGVGGDALELPIGAIRALKGAPGVSRVCYNLVYCALHAPHEHISVNFGGLTHKCGTFFYCYYCVCHSFQMTNKIRERKILQL